MQRYRARNIDCSKGRSDFQDPVQSQTLRYDAPQSATFGEKLLRGLQLLGASAKGSGIRFRIEIRVGSSSNAALKSADLPVSTLTV